MNCLDSSFLYDCRNCQHCFGCCNLRNKKYHFFNQPLTKEEYENKMQIINLGRRSVLEEYRTKFLSLARQAIRRATNNVKAVNSVGDLLHNCRNCFQCFGILGGIGPSDNLRYVISVDKANDSMDVSGGNGFSLCYETGGITSSSKVYFSVRMRGNNLQCEYCYECSDCEYCFGCFALRNKKFCIFNKQYSEQDYWLMIDKIKVQMLKTGEYGEFFSLTISPFPYQDSDASIEFPLTKEEIIKNNWHWQDETKDGIDLSKFDVFKAIDVPDDIADVSDDILNKAFICEQTGKPFRITKFELDFYRAHKLPLPTIHPLQRIKDRFAFRHPYMLWQYACSNCGRTMLSAWDPARRYKVYCEDCYLKEVV